MHFPYILSINQNRLVIQPYKCNVLQLHQGERYDVRMVGEVLQK